MEARPITEQETNDAAALIIAAQCGSITLLQKRMRIGATRAASLIAALEAGGIVGPPNKYGKRAVLVPRPYDTELVAKQRAPAATVEKPEPKARKSSNTQTEGFRLCKALYGPGCACSRNGKLICENIKRRVAEAALGDKPKKEKGGKNERTPKQ